jgi:chromosome partitioning protein
VTGSAHKSRGEEPYKENAMKTIVIASQKGGTGKTTTCTNLAVAAAKGRANRVAVIDGDDQASLSDWVRDREKNTDAAPGSVRQLPLFDFGKLEDAIEVARVRGIEWLFVDTEPSTKSTARGFIEIADLVVVPVRPSLPDARSAGVTFDIANELGKPILTVLTMAKPRTVALREFASRFRARALCADSVLYDRQAYPLAFALGLGVIETDPHDTGMQVRALLAEVEAGLAPKSTPSKQGRAA